MTLTDDPLNAESHVEPLLEHDVRTVTDRVARRLIEAIEHDDDRAEQGGERRVDLLAGDERRQLLLIGGWIGEEVALLNEERLRAGTRPFGHDAERLLRSRVVAELAGAGPLEPFLSDPTVEEIDVNGPGSTWITYTDGRKIDVGRLWQTAAELTGFQKRMVSSSPAEATSVPSGLQATVLTSRS